MKRDIFCLEQKFAVYRNEHAFTLLEMLFAFSIFLVIIFFISPLVQLMAAGHGLETRLQDMEWEVFSSQIKKEIRMSTNAQVVGQTLILADDKGTVSIEKYGNTIRRRVNSKGHEVILQNVSQLTFTELNNGVKITVKDLNGKTYMLTVYSYIQWGDGG